MAAKALVVFCVQALFIQSSFSQCVGSVAAEANRFAGPYGLGGRGWGYDGLAYDSALPARGLGLGCGSAIDITPTSGGGLVVSSGSAIPPVGVSLASENVYEGILAAAGELPFVGTVEVDGVVPTAGAGAVNYGCGNGVTVMESVADVIAPGIAEPVIGAFGGIAPAAAIGAPGLGYRAGWANLGCGGVLEY